MSPYLFVVIMEDLRCLLKRAKGGGYLTRVRVRKIGGRGEEVSHLLFTDEILVFCEAS